MDASGVYDAECISSGGNDLVVGMCDTGGGTDCCGVAS